MSLKNNNFTGLTSEQAHECLLKDGPNCLPESKPPGFVLLFLRQFKSPFIYVLLIAAIVSFSLGQNINGIFIFAVLLLNATIGSFQEYSAERAALALNAMVPQMANVLRDGHTQKIDSKDLVIGDLVFIASGDRVPADGKCLETNQLTIDESLLTGESLEVLKSADLATNETDNNGSRNLCYAGSSVVRGRGLLEITATGIDTEIGKIAAVVSQEDQIKPPLLQRIERFTLRVTFATLIIISLIFVISLVRGEALSQVFFLGVALAVSAIPEGLPAAITVALAIGMRRMAKKNVIVRSLLAVESLGSCTYIASDKTGTLTVNDMTVQKLSLLDGCEYKVTGEGLDIHGTISPDNEQALHNQHAKEKMEVLCRIGVLCNESELYLKDSHWQAEGDQVDIAFLILQNKLGQSHQQLQQRFPEISRIPYESENAFSASLNRFNGEFILCVKGSVEKLLEMVTLDNKSRQRVLDKVDELGHLGFRTLALGHKQLPQIPKKLEEELCEIELVGLVGIIDPLRKEATAAMDNCRLAEVEVAMVTGDHPETARAIAKQLKITHENETVVTGKDISNLSQNNPQRLSQMIRDNHTFARVKPVEKQIIVETLQNQGHFVAVTGDGVNDAPALKTAHVGVAMGKRGTDVARESSDLILTDDNFSSIVNGIIEGRIVYANIRKVVFLLISTGAAEILLFILSLLAGLPLPLFPIQLLWLNLVTNGVQDVALAFEPAEGNELKRPPRDPKESIFNRIMIERVLVNAVVMGSIAFALFALSMKYGMSEGDARNLTLLLMVLFENVHALNSRSESQSLFKMNFFSNKLLLLGILIAQSIHIGAMYTETFGNLLQISPVTFDQWLYLLIVALVLVIVDESHKWWHRNKQKQQ